jgi:hypothetical protein
MWVKGLNAVCVVPNSSEEEKFPLKVYIAGLDGLHFQVYKRLRLEPCGRATKKSNSLSPGCFILILCSKGKVVAVQALKAYRGSRCMIPLLLNLEMVQFTPGFSAVKDPR